MMPQCAMLQGTDSALTLGWHGVLLTYVIDDALIAARTKGQCTFVVKTLIFLPRKQKVLLLERGNKHAPEVVPPQQLKSDPVGGLVGLALIFIAFDLVVDPPGRNVAMCKPGAELGAVIPP